MDPFESEQLDGAAEDSGEAWDEEGFEDDAFAAADGADDDSMAEEAFDEEGEGAAADGLDEEGFEDDAFEEDGFEDADGLEASDGFEEGDPLEASDADGFAEGDGGDEMEEAFTDAMDAADDDEFAQRLSAQLRRRLGRAARPFLRRMAARAVPIGLQLIRQVSRLKQTGAGRFDAMDAFADAAADEASSAEEMDEFIPFLAGLAGRYVTRAILSASGGRKSRRAARALGRASARAARRAAQAIVRKHGPAAVRSVPRVVRQVVRVAKQQRGGARAVPRMIRRAGVRVAASRRAAARLSRPSPAVKRVASRARASSRGGVVRPIRPGMRSGGSPRGVTTLAPGSTVIVRGPVRIVTQGGSTPRPRRAL